MTYKTFLRERIKIHNQKSGRTVTLKKLSEHLDVQYTYLSRILNSEHEHLREDVLFEALSFLGCSSQEIEYGLCLRIAEASSSLSRKQMAEKTISKLQLGLAVDIEEKSGLDYQWEREANFLLDPLATIVLATLTIKKYQKDARPLIEFLNLSIDKLKEVLEKIEAAGYIERDEDWFRIKKMNETRMHFTATHPLMRVHQDQIKSLCQTHLKTIVETEKKAFMATFVADQTAFEKIKAEFNGFISKVEKIASSASAKKTYQINFDLFPWF